MIYFLSLSFFKPSIHQTECHVGHVQYPCPVHPDLFKVICCLRLSVSLLWSFLCFCGRTCGIFSLSRCSSAVCDGRWSLLVLVPMTQITLRHPFSDVHSCFLFFFVLFFFLLNVYDRYHHKLFFFFLSCMCL